MVKPKKSKPKWHLDIKISRIDGKPLTKTDRALLNHLATALRSIENANVQITAPSDPESRAV
jgi:hypothetical protein